MIDPITVVCEYCAGDPLITITHELGPFRTTEAEWQAYWKVVQAPTAKTGRPRHGLDMECGDCGGQFDLVYDGARFGRSNVSRPRIDSIVVDGTKATLTGQALDIGALVVNVGGDDAVIVSRTSTEAVITIPSGEPGSLDVLATNEYGERKDGSSRVVDGIIRP